MFPKGMKGHNLLSVMENMGKERDSNFCGSWGYWHHFIRSHAMRVCPNSTDGVGAEFIVGKGS